MAGRASDQSIFLRAIGLQSPAGRAAYLDDVCEGDAGLRSELDALVAAHDRLGSGAPPTGGNPTAVRRSTEAAGTVLDGRYRLVEQIGEGGIGTVWMAQKQEPVKRLVAVKPIKAGMAECCERLEHWRVYPADADTPDRDHSPPPGACSSPAGRSSRARMNDVAGVPSATEAGEPQAAERLLPLVYDELRRLAAQKMAREWPGQTLAAAALVHEA